MFRIITILCAFTLMWSCQSTDDFSIIPSIKYVSVTKSSLVQGDLNQDSLWLTFSFQDGDGDLAYSANGSEKDIFLYDKRLGLLLDSYKIPELSNTNGNSLEGSMQILIYTTCCLFKDNIPPCSAPPQYPTDTLLFELYIKDRAGHESNRITSQAILLYCN
ncbi:MAG: hypothetical protein IPG55_03985 [Saprospiraceae bacterium]|nr:hypothetical protein [Candidatus Defluviibacterium haderslevense]MBK7244787.1 hypothetical protein [Candidatus Defluviibacterium haderslevense]